MEQQPPQRRNEQPKRRWRRAGSKIGQPRAPGELYQRPPTKKPPTAGGSSVSGFGGEPPASPGEQKRYGDAADDDRE